ncbi:MAG: NTP transferase domain-containing protein [Alphaproteobacteria bacterium]
MKTAGLLLAGGHSRRFGAEKAMADFRGKPMIEVVAERFAKLDGIVVSARAQSGAAAFAINRGIRPHRRRSRSARRSAHRHRRRSGLGGGARGARTWRSRRAIRRCCHTISTPDSAPARGLPPRPLPPPAKAINRSARSGASACLAPLRAPLAAGDHPSIKDFLHAHRARRVMFEDAAAFANANTLAELDRLAAL